MSLSEAVLEIAQQMQEDSDGTCGDDAGSLMAKLTLQNYSRQLRSAVKAAEGSEQLKNNILRGGMTEQQRLEFERSNEALRRDREERARRLAQEAEQEPRMVEIAGTGEWVGADPTMPPGARCNINGVVYVMKPDGKLHAEGGQK